MVPLAHAGGWDEILFTLLPAVVFFFILQFSRMRREARQVAQRASEDQTEEPPGSIDSRPL